jgi:hypothetical protein
MRACYNNQLLYFLLYCCTKMYMLLRTSFLWKTTRPTHADYMVRIIFSTVTVRYSNITFLFHVFTPHALQHQHSKLCRTNQLSTSTQTHAAETAVPAPKANRYYSRDGSSHVPGHVRWSAASGPAPASAPAPRRRRWAGDSAWLSAMAGHVRSSPFSGMGCALPVRRDPCHDDANPSASGPTLHALHIAKGNPNPRDAPKLLMGKRNY